MTWSVKWSLLRPITMQPYLVHTTLYCALNHDSFTVSNLLAMLSNTIRGYLLTSRNSFQAVLIDSSYFRPAQAAFLHIQTEKTS